MAKNKIYTLNDVRQWRALKKDELDLEKLKFHAEKDQVKTQLGKGLGKILLYEGLFIMGEKLLTTMIKSFFKSSKKKKDDSAKERKVDPEE